MSDPNLPAAFDVLVRTFLVMAMIVLASRIFGLRSFSKMSGFDFPVAVAFGSVLASSVTSPDQSIWVPLFAVVSLFAWQMVVSPLRKYFRSVERAVDNRPLMVMENGEILEDNLRSGGMTRQDLMAKLREANVSRLEEVNIAVIEGAGDFTVIRGAKTPSPELLENVRRR